MKRQVYEQKLLNYISKEFAAIDARFNAFSKEIDKKKKAKKELRKVKNINLQ